MRTPGARFLFRINAALVALHAAIAILVLPSVPERIPLHFGLSGQPDRWADGDPVTWLLLPMVSAFTAFVIWGSTRLALRQPHLWNVPDRDRFLRMTPQERAPVIDSLLRFLGWTALAVTALFAVLHVGVYRVAVGNATGLDGVDWVILALVIGILAAALVLNRRIRRRIRKAVPDDER